MPKVTFVNEHRVIEVQKGRTISEIADELGIAVCREEFVGTGIGNYTVWVKGEDGCVSPPDFWERLKGAKGWRRFANKTKVLGDVEVFTQGGMSDRLRSPRPIAAPPNPSKDKTAKRLGESAAATAAFPYGHPKQVGEGKRDAVARNTGKPKAAGKAGAAAAAEEEEAEGDE